MRRDTQIGVILVVTILVIIGVFLSTRSSVKKTEMSDLVLPEKGIYDEIEKIDVDKIIKESKPDAMKEATPVDRYKEESRIEYEEFAAEVLDESSVKDEAIVEGRWEGFETETGDTVEKDSEDMVSEKESKEALTETEQHARTARVNDQSYSIEKMLTISEREQQTPMTDTKTEVVHEVLPNENLFNISKKYYGSKDKWTIIYEANRDKIADPRVLYVGQELLIPDAKGYKEDSEGKAFESLTEKKPVEEAYKTTRTHIVKRGDTLYDIARKYYNDPAKWSKIYDANYDIIEDKKFLRVGQTLVIPE